MDREVFYSIHMKKKKKNRDYCEIKEYHGILD